MATQKLRRSIPTNPGGLLSELLPSVPDHLWWVMPESCEGLTQWTPAQEIKVDYVRETRSEVGCILLPSGSDRPAASGRISCLAYAEWDSGWADFIVVEYAQLQECALDSDILMLPADAEMVRFLVGDAS